MHSVERLTQIPLLVARARRGEYAPAEYVARYLLCWQLARRGKNFALRRARSQPLPDPHLPERLDALDAPKRIAALEEFFFDYRLHGVSERAHIAVASWLRGAWPLVWCERIPDVREVLRMQARGTRPVTVIAEYPRLRDPVLDKPDALAFLCHDLEHAWQFFHDAELHRQQRRFAAWMLRAIEQDLFAHCRADATFAQRFDYLAADMNAHVAHALQYLRAIVLEWYLRREGKAPHDSLSPDGRAAFERCLAEFARRSGLEEEAPQWRPYLSSAIRLARTAAAT